MRLHRRSVLTGAAIVPFAAGAVVRFAAPDDDDRWNACIAWAGERMRMLHGVRVRHVREAAAADLVSEPHGRRHGPPWRVRGWVAVHDPARGVVPADLTAWVAADPDRLAPCASLAEARARFAAGIADVYLARNPGEAACGIARGVLPPGARATSLAPPTCDVLIVRRDAPPGARLLARFLTSAEAQAHFADPWHCAAPRLQAAAYPRWRVPPSLRVPA